MSKIRTIVASMFLATTVAIIGCSNVRPMLSPSFDVGINNQSKIHEAIREALLSRRWAILAQRPNGFDAEYKRSADMNARVRITHTGNKVSISYLDSAGLKYNSTEGIQEIHRRYNTWVLNLEKDIQVEIGKRL